MAVFSYTSRQKLIGSATIANYANVQISAYANIEIESLTDFYSDGIDFIDINSTSLEEVSYSHNESSARYVLSEGEYNYGSITNIESLLSDYGSIVDPIYTSRQVDDYGSITLSETIVPYGSLFEVESFGDLKLSRISIGDVTLTVLGTASIFVTPREFGRGGVGIKGDAYVTFNLRYFGSGNLFAFDSSAESSVYNDTEEIALFKFTGSAVEKNTESYVGSGSLYTFISSTETSISNPPEETILFKFSGYSVERFIASHAGSGKFTNDIQIDQKVTYSYNESSRIDIFVSDYGLISESTIDYEDDYGPLTDLDYLGRETADYGHYGSGSLFTFISGTESTLKPASVDGVLYQFHGEAIERFGKGNYDGSGSLFTFDSSTESTLVSPDSYALFDISGDAYVTASLNYVGSGSLFTFISGTESTVSNPPEDIVRIKITGTCEEAYVPGGYQASGTLFTIVSGTETVSYVPKSTNIFTISGSASESYLLVTILQKKVLYSDFLMKELKDLHILIVDLLNLNLEEILHIQSLNLVILDRVNLILMDLQQNPYLLHHILVLDPYLLSLVPLKQQSSIHQKIPLSSDLLDLQSRKILNLTLAMSILILKDLSIQYLDYVILDLDLYSHSLELQNLILHLQMIREFSLILKEVQLKRIRNPILDLVLSTHL